MPVSLPLRLTAVVVTSIMALVATSAPTIADAPVDDTPDTSSPRAVARVADCRPYTPAVAQAYFNDPRTGYDNTVIQDLEECRFNQVPTGGFIRIATFSLTDKTLTDLLARRHRAGVNVQLVVDGSKCGEDIVKDLKAELGNHSGARADGSRLVCSKGSARSRGPVMHTKFITLTSSGGARYITIVGSANLSGEGVYDQWNDMFQYVDRRDVYAAYTKIHAQLLANRDLSRPAYSWRAQDNIARADFLPANNPADKAQDPAWNRLTTLPGKGTVVRLAMYSWHRTPRGLWLRDALIALRKKGAAITVLTGPPTDDVLEADLRRAGIAVTRAFERTCAGGDHVDRGCSYIHLKFMTAKYTQFGEVQYRTWTGSDNFVDLRSDEVVQRIGGKRTHDDYAVQFAKIRSIYS